VVFFVVEVFLDYCFAMESRFAVSLGSLQEKRVGDVWPQRDIIWVFSYCKVDTALITMKEERILSLPVVNPLTNICIGVVDILDIALFVVSSFPTLENISFDNLRWLQDTTVLEVMAFAKQFNFSSLPLFPFKVDTPILELMKTFSSGVHRVPVVDEKNKILNFISQSDLNRYLCENIYLCGENQNKNVTELGLSAKVVVYARGDAIAIQALDIMARNRLSALPVVDLDGDLIGNFSASDLRGMGPGDFVHLLRPIGQVLVLYNPRSLFPLTCKPTDSLEHVMLKLAGAKVHRLWVVDENKKILGVIALTDVMKPFLNIPGPMEISQITTPLLTPFVITPAKPIRLTEPQFPTSSSASVKIPVL